MKRIITIEEVIKLKINHDAEKAKEAYNKIMEIPPIGEDERLIKHKSINTWYGWLEMQLNKIVEDSYFLFGKSSNKPDPAILVVQITALKEYSRAKDFLHEMQKTLQELS